VIEIVRLFGKGRESGRVGKGRKILHFGLMFWFSVQVGIKMERMKISQQSESSLILPIYLLILYIRAYTFPLILYINV
jgi:hypothetical protein